MSDGIVELPVGSGGEKLDSTGLSVAAQNVVRQRVVVAGEGEGATDLVAGGAAPLATNVYGLGVRKITDRSSVQQFFDAVVLDDSPTSADSSNFDSSPYRYGVLYLDVAKVGTPQNLRIIQQLSDDAGVTFFDTVMPGWPVDISDMGSVPLKISFPVPLVGRLTRYRLEGTGTDGSNTLTVSLSAEFYN